MSQLFRFCKSTGFFIIPAIVISLGLSLHAYAQEEQEAKPRNPELDAVSHVSPVTVDGHILFYYQNFNWYAGS